MHMQRLAINPDFLKLWAAQTASFVGSHVTMLALPLTAAVTLDASVAQMGLLRALDLAPALVVGVFAGAWVDRVRRRPILVAADIGRALLLGAIPLAAWLHVLQIGHLYVVAFCVGILTVLFDVAHLSLLPALVPRDRLVDGNSRLEMSRSVAMIAGPGLGGWLVQVLTAPIAIVVDALSFLLSALLLLLIGAPEPRPAVNPQSTLWMDMATGFRAVWNQRLLRTMALSLAVFNLFYHMVGAVYVLYVVRELGLSPGELGLIYAVGSAGFPLGALAAVAVARRIGVGPTIVWGAGLSDAAFLLIPLAGAFPATALPLLIAAQFLATLGGPATAINQISLRQAITPDHLQGRVNGTMRVLALGTAPLGALLAGSLGASVGLRPTLLIGALGLQLGFVVLLCSPLRALASPRGLASL